MAISVTGGTTSPTSKKGKGKAKPKAFTIPLSFWEQHVVQATPPTWDEHATHLRDRQHSSLAGARAPDARALGSTPALAAARSSYAAACLLAAVAAADDDVLPSVLMKVPLLMSSLQPSHLLELGDDDEARRTSGS